MSVLNIIYIYFYQPETTGRSYEELDELYMKHVPARAFKTFVTEAERQGQEASKRAGT
jgi:SP family general alpha glucoside:H+ symporter-like MFS transporter